MISLSHLTKQYDIAGRSERIVALQDCNLNDEDNNEFYSIRRGEFVIIRGPSGGGKTTLLNILGTLDHPSEGELCMFGSRVTVASDDAFLANLRLKRIGFVFQTFNLLAAMSAFENVELPMIIEGSLSAAERKERALTLLKQVGLQDRENHLPSELSGGEQQRTTIARALSNKPDLLLLDEPTGDLDTRNTVDVMDLILDINLRQSTTCVMVTHNPDLECYADRILYVQDGKFIKQAINDTQSRIDYDAYIKYINTHSANE